MGGLVSLHHGRLAKLMFLPWTHWQQRGQPAFPGTWVLHGPRGRTVVFQQGRPGELLFFPR
jgi:hypothetical protein